MGTLYLSYIRYIAVTIFLKSSLRPEKKSKLQEVPGEFRVHIEQLDLEQVVDSK